MGTEVNHVITTGWNSVQIYLIGQNPIMLAANTCIERLDRVEIEKKWSQLSNWFTFRD